MKSYHKLTISLAIPLLAGFVGSLLTSPSIRSGWYQSLPKPILVPPNWIFPIVWTALFVLMGIALYLVWVKKKQYPEKRLALLLFAVQLMLNLWWSLIFFHLQRPSWAFLEIILLWLSISATMIVFKRIDRRASWLLLPYLLWVTFAAFLNYGVALG